MDIASPSEYHQRAQINYAQPTPLINRKALWDIVCVDCVVIHIVSAWKFFEDLIKARDAQPPLLPKLSATGYSVATCGELGPQ